ncbi:hypothetical protein H0E84_19320 [Luteimonas sp. SJ-92]|uniref:DUF2188 domain-containing protein n=1 Tax=Luteimonas salinisoli TaxID=2752307 RepID=A0A853JJ87_9GAMM|nr:hypothetical protein [Luteimonas salinisoli]NZA28528.1 hypothetical protein [Luteimonas salinisoli]
MTWIVHLQPGIGYVLRDEAGAEYLPRSNWPLAFANSEQAQAVATGLNEREAARAARRPLPAG